MSKLDLKFLTTEEELDLFNIYRTGSAEESKKAERLLFESQYLYVIKVANGFKTSFLTLDDLVQEGSLGLLTAIEKFDPARGCRLIASAKWWILSAIQHAIESDELTISIPSNKKGFFIPTISIDTPISNEDTVADLIPCGDRTETHSLDDDYWNDLLNQLKPNERKVITERFGMNDSRSPKTLQEIGNQTGVTREAVRLIEKRALTKLRKYVNLKEISH